MNRPATREAQGVPGRARAARRRPSRARARARDPSRRAAHRVVAPSPWSPVSVAGHRRTCRIGRLKRRRTPRRQRPRHGTSLNGSVLNVTLELTPGAEGNGGEGGMPSHAGDGGYGQLAHGGGYGGREAA